MSSRALRKLQKQQELEKQLVASKAADEQVEDEQEEQSPVAPKPPNAFDMLDGMDELESDEDEDYGATLPTRDTTSQIQPQPIPSQSSKPRKKKKKAKKKGKGRLDSPATKSDELGMDEIDLALNELTIKNGRHTTDDVDAKDNAAERRRNQMLATESKNLNPINEMRSLFGNIALEGSSSRSSPRPQRQRDQNQQEGVDLATALTGRNSIASRNKELGALATRRNVFFQGRPEWPLATSGGLSMEQDAQTKQYNIAHSSAYQGVQRDFRRAVETMQPQAMVYLLTMNPYHIASLLQVSEIAKHQGDHSCFADLLERALFTFGRSVHSSFPAALREGAARVPFNKPANRELYLTIWRYIRNLEMRGTWRTAFEWAKILYQLDPVSDPFGVTLMIDQLALRGRQQAALIEMCSEGGWGGLTGMWGHLPNIQISLALAYQRSSQPKLARQTLAVAMSRYPYVLSSLASNLDIDPLPAKLWGQLPRSDTQNLYSELYAIRAKDLWNTPEATSLLVEVTETIDHYSPSISAAGKAPDLEISLEEARHIVLLETPQLIALLPRRFTNMPTSSSDVLPPPNSDADSDFTLRAPRDNSGPSAVQTLLNAAGTPINGLHGMLTRILDWFHRPAEANEVGNDGEEALRELRDALGQEVTPELMQELLQIQEANDIPLIAEGLHDEEGDLEYYRGMAESNGDDELPDLESIPDESRNPHAARVEDDNEEDEENTRSTRATVGGGAVLRHRDSDDEDEADGHHHQWRATQPQMQPVPAPASAQETDILDTNDPQRVQRWLLSLGLDKLKSDPATLSDYVSKLRILRKQQQEWVVNMVRQRAGVEVAESIGRMID